MIHLLNRSNARGFWLVKRMLGWKNFMPKNFLENNQYFALRSCCNTIGQLNNSFSILGFSLAGKWTLTETIFQVHKKSSNSSCSGILYCFSPILIQTNYIAALTVHVSPSYRSRPSLSMTLFCLYITCLCWWFFGETGVPAPGKAMKIVTKPPAKQAIPVS